MLDTGQVIDGIFAAASTGDLDEVMSWWAADGVLEDVTLAQVFTGTAEIREYLEMYFGALPDVRYEPIRVVVSGPTAVVEWAQNAHIAKPFDGIENSVGQEVFMHALDMFHIADGLVQHEVSWYGDGWFRQRLDGVSDIRPALPVTPPVGLSGKRFG
jgi:ketosteroid isomerase-like protein